MSNFKKISSKKDFYIGFVDNQDKYDKLGYLQTLSDYYQGQFKNGAKLGYGAYISRTVDNSKMFGRMINDLLDGIGLFYSRGKALFGYFQNGNFESGFNINIGQIEFICKKHKNYILDFFNGCFSETKDDEEERDKYRSILKKMNPDGTATKQIDEATYYMPEDTEEAFNKFISQVLDVERLPLLDLDIYIKDNYYGIDIDSFRNFGIYDDKNWRITNKNLSIKKEGNSIIFNISECLKLTLFENSKADAILEYKNARLKIEGSIFKMESTDVENYAISIDQDFNVSQYITSCGSNMVKLLTVKHELDDEVKYRYNENIEEELNRLIGLKKAKQQLRRIISYVVKNKGKKLNIHMAFMGNPGTGKTTFAKLIADLLYKYGILPTNKFINGNRSTLVGRYIGHTAPKTKKVIDDAMGGVLLIDEAYALADKGDKKSFGSEAIEVLIQEMENRRGEFCCILAGYKAEMEELFNSNPGFKSRIQFIIDFEDFTYEEIESIVKDLLKEQKLETSPKVFEKMMSILDYMKSQQYFGNARDCRNLIEQLAMIAQDRDDYNGEITLDDISIYMKENTLFEKKVSRTNMIDIGLVDKYINETNSDDDFEQSLEDSILLMVNRYDKDLVKGSGVVISPDGYAITMNLRPNECINSSAVRYTLDRYGNTIKGIIDVASANDNKYSIIKLENDGDLLSYLALEIIPNEKLIDNTYKVCGIIGKDNKNILRYTNGKVILDNNNLKVEYDCDGVFYDGAFLLNEKTRKIVGFIIDGDEFVPSNDVYTVIKENQGK